ncbi:hypothetical protein [Pantoea piersonii]|jgi:hypothetical protein|uniref:hypothetical protein n=1 Tax=Pantoea piersonii TaxID=2364647 RepID=UPI000EA040D5|nr:hypothetical protein [Pantoea piersonii]MBZ6386793.1 hypothetical protein [Pantoea piersonii]MBZ6400058.1 hypothetical protein [Pantoea piersonii]MBZ6409112.1 hypothetical protein [Pantoea piersonii]MBZ6426109.1 hypothetical protein [Pantoea piersonii]NYB04666.1 hypothetical protein [Pantoea piersonii]
MDASQLVAKVNHGNGMAAQRLGNIVSHYRATSPFSPLKTTPLQLLPASFVADNSYMRAARYGQASRIGIFDATLFREGDFLVSPSEGTFYVAAMPLLQPVLCVKAERLITFRRTTSEGPGIGMQEYGGTTTAREEAIMTDWPASILLIRSGEHSPLRLPADTRSAGYSILMSAFRGIQMQAGDFVSDETGRRYVITGSELTDMGWRLIAMRVSV